MAQGYVRIGTPGSIQGLSSFDLFSHTPDSIMSESPSFPAFLEGHPLGLLQNALFLWHVYEGHPSALENKSSSCSWLKQITTTLSYPGQTLCWGLALQEKNFLNPGAAMSCFPLTGQWSPIICLKHSSGHLTSLVTGMKWPQEQMRPLKEQERIIRSSVLQTLKNKYFWIGHCTCLNKEAFEGI